MWKLHCQVDILLIIQLMKKSLLQYIMVRILTLHLLYFFFPIKLTVTKMNRSDAISRPLLKNKYISKFFN